MDLGTNGRVSDGGVWAACRLKSAIEDGSINIPHESLLPGSGIAVPHVFVADDAFPLKPYLMKPFPFRNQSNEVRIFSYCLSRARRTVENAFGILANRFRVLLSPINLEPCKVQKIVLACVELHYFLISENGPSYTECSGISENSTDAQQPELISLQRTGGMPNKTARNARDLFKNYFNNEGSVP